MIFNATVQSPLVSLLPPYHDRIYRFSHVPKLYNHDPSLSDYSSSASSPSDSDLSYIHTSQMDMNSHPSNMSGYSNDINLEGNLLHYTQSPVDQQQNVLSSHSQGYDFRSPQMGLPHHVASHPSIYSNTSRARQYPTPDISQSYASDMDEYMSYPQAPDDESHSPTPSTGSSTYSQSRGNSPEPTDEETEKWLRRNLSIPEPLPLTLASLPDQPFGSKNPKISDLIKLAIWGSRDHKLTLRQIYAAIEERYPSYRNQKDKPWQRSIRHNLSLKAIFVRMERPTSHPGKGYYWKLNVYMGDRTTRDRKRKDPRDGREEDEDLYLSDVSTKRYSSTHSSVHAGARRTGMYTQPSLGAMRYNNSPTTGTPFNNMAGANVYPDMGMGLPPPRDPYHHGGMSFTAASGHHQQYAPVSPWEDYRASYSEGGGHSAQDTYQRMPMQMHGMSMAQGGYVSGPSLLRRPHSDTMPDADEGMRRGAPRTRPGHQ